MKKIYITLLHFILFISCITTQGQTITELGFFSPLISTFEMKYSSNHVLITQQGLKIFDVSNPANPTLVGQAPYFGSYAYQIAVDQNRAYLAEGGGGYFAVYNISNFSAPALMGYVQIPSTDFVGGGDLIIHNNTAYLTGGDSLYIIDVTVSTTPVLISSQQIINSPFGIAEALVADSNRLCVLTSTHLKFYDISNPLIASITDSIVLTHTYNNGLAVDTVNHRVFSPWVSALQTHQGYNAYDISSGSPVFLFSDSVTFGPGDFNATDYYNNVLAITKGGGVNMFDVSPSSHGFLTSFTGQNVPNASVSVEFRDSIFYNARGGGFEILKLNGGFPTAVGEINYSNVHLYPNPAVQGEEINVSVQDNTAPATFRILNTSGQTLLNVPDTDQTFSISTRQLKPGIYILNSQTKTTTSNTKFVVY